MTKTILYAEKLTPSQSKLPGAFYSYKDIYNRIKDRIHPANGVPIVQHAELLASLISTECGIGDSLDTTRLALLKLIEHGCQNIHFCKIRSTPYSDGSYHHLIFALIGDITPLKAGDPLSSFSKINDRCVLIAPSLNVVGPANQLNTLLKNHIVAFKLSQVMTANKISEKLYKATPALLKKAKKVGERIKSQGFSYQKSVQLTQKSEEKITVSETAKFGFGAGSR